MPESVDRPAPERTSTSPSATRSARASNAGSAVPVGAVSRALTPPSSLLGDQGAAAARPSLTPQPSSPVRARPGRARSETGAPGQLVRPLQVTVGVHDAEVVPQGPAVPEDLVVAETPTLLEPPLERGRVRTHAVAPPPG